MKSVDASEYHTFEEELKTQGWFCWTNVGTSMMPLLRQGRDLMIIRRKEPGRCRRHEAVLYKRINANGTVSLILHRILKVRKDGTYWIVGDNCGHGEVVRDEQILGILTAIVRDGKREIPVTNFWYRLYVHLWCDVYPLRLILIRLRNRLRRNGTRPGLISVVIPVYNVEEYLAECLDSLRRQTYGHWEAICVDDGSTDGSLEILRRYAAMDSRIRFCVQENCGQSVARNRGRGMASGEYCHFLDADDMLRADAFEKCVSIMKARHLDHLIFGTELLVDPRVADQVDVRGYRDYYTVDESLLDKVSSGKQLFADLVAKRSFFVQPSMRLSRTDSLPPGELFPADAPPHEDNYSTPRILLAAARAMVIPDRLYVRRLRPQSCVTSESPRRTHANAYLSVYRLLGPLCRRERDPSVARQLRAYRRFIYEMYCRNRKAPPTLVQRGIDAFRLEPDMGAFFRRLAGFVRRAVAC